MEGIDDRVSRRSFEFLVNIDVLSRQERIFETVTIALVGKYTDLKDSYMSVTKALEHSAFRIHRKLKIEVRALSFLHYSGVAHYALQWVESSDLEETTKKSNPAKYHDAWKMVVGAGYVPMSPLLLCGAHDGSAVFSCPEGSGSEELRA